MKRNLNDKFISKLKEKRLLSIYLNNPNFYFDFSTRDGEYIIECENDSVGYIEKVKTDREFDLAIGNLKRFTGDISFNKIVESVLR